MARNDFNSTMLDINSTEGGVEFMERWQTATPTKRGGESVEHCPEHHRTKKASMMVRVTKERRVPINGKIKSVVDDEMLCPTCGRRLSKVHMSDAKRAFALVCGFIVPEKVPTLIGAKRRGGGDGGTT